MAALKPGHWEHQASCIWAAETAANARYGGGSRGRETSHPSQLHHRDEDRAGHAHESYLSPSGANATRPGSLAALDDTVKAGILPGTNQSDLENSKEHKN